MEEKEQEKENPEEEEGVGLGVSHLGLLLVRGYMSSNPEPLTPNNGFVASG